MIKFLTSLFTVISWCFGVSKAHKIEKKQEAYNEKVEKIQADPVNAFMAEFVDGNHYGANSVSKPTEPEPVVPSSETNAKPRPLKRRFNRKGQQRNSKPKRFK
jgi:hypothetical protein